MKLRLVDGKELEGTPEEIAEFTKLSRPTPLEPSEMPERLPQSRPFSRKLGMSHTLRRVDELKQARDEDRKARQRIYQQNYLARKKAKEAGLTSQQRWYQKNRATVLERARIRYKLKKEAHPDETS